MSSLMKVEHQENSIQQLRSKIGDQLTYLNRIKRKYPFPDRKSIFNQLSYILIGIRTKQMTAAQAVIRLTDLWDLFKGDIKMITGFKAFLPFDVEIEVKRDSNKGTPGITLNPVCVTNLDNELDEICKQTDDFVIKVWICFLKRRDKFKKFINILEDYQKQKLNGAMNPEAKLDLQITKLLGKYDFLTSSFKRLRLPDVLAIIPFHYWCMPKLLKEITSAEDKPFNDFIDEVKERFREQPLKKQSFMGLVERRRDELISAEDFDSQLAILFQGHEDLWTKFKATFETHKRYQYTR